MPKEIKQRSKWACTVCDKVFKLASAAERCEGRARPPEIEVGAITSINGAYVGIVGPGRFKNPHVMQYPVVRAFVFKSGVVDHSVSPSDGVVTIDSAGRRPRFPTHSPAGVKLLAQELQDRGLVPFVWDGEVRYDVALYLGVDTPATVR